MNLKKTGGWDGLTELIYNTTASLNGFDQYGHFGRTRVTLSVCTSYQANKGGQHESGCTARFNGPGHREGASTSAAELYSLLQQSFEARTGGTAVASGPAIGIGQNDSTSHEAETEAKEEGEAEVSEASETGGGTKPLLDYLLGP